MRHMRTRITILLATPLVVAAVLSPSAGASGAPEAAARLSLRQAPWPAYDGQAVTVRATLSPPLSDGQIRFTAGGPFAGHWSCVPRDGSCGAALGTTPDGATWVVRAVWSGDKSHRPASAKLVASVWNRPMAPFQVTVDPALTWSPAAGGRLSTPVLVSVRGANGYPVAGDLVRLKASCGSVTPVVRTGPSGQALASYTTGTGTGGTDLPGVLREGGPTSQGAPAPPLSGCLSLAGAPPAGTRGKPPV
jgi:hypothetical protein